MATDLTMLMQNRSLPLSFRGYDRDATDQFLTVVQRSFESLLAEREETQARIAALDEKLTEAASRLIDLGSQLADAEVSKDEISEALLVAVRVRADAEREAEELRDDYARRREAMEADVRRRADDLIREAQAAADRIIEDAKLRAGNAEQDFRNAAQLADETRGTLASFLETILDEVQRSKEALSVALDERADHRGTSTKSPSEDDSDGWETIATGAEAASTTPVAEPAPPPLT